MQLRASDSHGMGSCPSVIFWFQTLNETYLNILPQAYATELQPLKMTSQTELTNLSGQNQSILTFAGAEVSDDDDDLTMEEMLYLQVYQNKLEDAGFVVGGAPPNTPVPWSFRHKTPILTKLRLIRWVSFLLSAAISLGTGIYLLVTTVQVRA
jgi:hypothetical protein